MQRTLRLHLSAFAIIALSACASGGGSSSNARGEIAGKPVDPTLVELGEKVWADKACHACHAFGGRLGAPDLAGIMERRDHDWLRAWMKSTDSMLVADPQAIAMMKDWHNARMPNMHLTDRQIEALFHYMAQRTAEVRAGQGGS